MKLKYKKIVLAVTMSTMCIGFVTISLTSPKVSNHKEENGTETVTTESAINAESNPEDETYNLECDAYPEINELVEKYLAATITGDMDTLESVVSDIDNISEDMVKNKTQIIEAHQNIQCYTVKVPNEDTFIVYVYSEMKLVGIDTPAPGLTRLYVCMTADGSYRIYLSSIDEEIQEFIQKSSESAQVKALIEKVNTLFENAISSDEKLKAFYQQIEDTAETQIPEDSIEPEVSEGMEETENPVITEMPSTTEAPFVTGTPATAGSSDIMTTDLPAEETEAAYE